jgi:release factor glutamine methyltransferase
VSQSTVATALAEGRAYGLGRLDAQLLLGHALKRPRTWLLAHDDAELSTVELAAWRALAARRAAGEPTAYLLGAKEFHGLTLQVGPAVLVPRPETELLVACGILALRRAASDGNRLPRLVDLGTGSGAVALAIKASDPAAQVCASDDSSGALDLARSNARRLGLDVDFRLGSWWEPWAGERFDVAVSNPPYIATDDPHLTALGHEPRHALVAADKGLAALRTVVDHAAAHLRPRGWLWLEHGNQQAEAVRELLASAGLDSVETCLDLAGRPRCTGGRHPGA